MGKETSVCSPSPVNVVLCMLFFFFLIEPMHPKGFLHKWFLYLCVCAFAAICTQSDRRTFRNVGSIYLLKWHKCGVFSIEPSAAVSQGKLTNPLIAPLVITECSWSRSAKPRRYFKLTSVLSPDRQVKERSAKAFLAESQRISAAISRPRPVAGSFSERDWPILPARPLEFTLNHLGIATMLRRYCSPLLIPKG